RAAGLHEGVEVGRRERNQVVYRALNVVIRHRLPIVNAIRAASRRVMRYVLRYGSGMPQPFGSHSRQTIPRNKRTRLIVSFMLVLLAPVINAYTIRYTVSTLARK
ncbi:MAG: hypothetical protein WC700_18830, partial [Gemmatimonadaceae bacterium]